MLITVRNESDARTHRILESTSRKGYEDAVRLLRNLNDDAK